jgi:hypothetical protein
MREAEVQVGNSAQTESSPVNSSGSCPRDPEAPGRGFFVHVASTIAAVEELRPIWGTWTHSRDTDIDYYLHNLRNDPTLLHPYVITIRYGEVVQAMLVGVVKKRRVSAVVAFVNICGLEARVLEILKGGWVGCQSTTIDLLLALQVSKAVRSGEIDYVSFKRLPLHSGLWREIQQFVDLRVKKRVSYMHDSVLPLTTPEGKRFPFLSGKLKREVRRKSRILNAAFPQKTRFKCFSNPMELDTGIRDAMMIAVRTWKYSLGWGLEGTLQNREDFNFFVKREWLRIYVLYVEDSPAAFLIGQLYNQTFYYQHVGYQPEFERFAVGWMLTEWALENLAAAGVGRVDFGEDNQDCNRRLGCKASEDGAVHVYAPTLRGFCLDTFFSGTQMVQAGYRGTVSSLHLNWTRKVWREFLIAIRTRQYVQVKPQAGAAEKHQSEKTLSKSVTPLAHGDVGKP